MSMMRHRNKNFNSMRRRARIREMDTSDLYRYDPYETPYSSTVQGKKLNRRMNGRSMGTCGSCRSRRRR